MNVIHVVLFGLLLLACGDNQARLNDGGAHPTDARVDGASDASVDAPMTGFVIGGTAIGVRGNVVLTLTTGTDTRHAAINADGPFVFPGRVDPGSSFTVTTANPCDLLGDSGTNVTADVSTVQAFCEGVVQLADVAFASGVPPVAFESALTPAFDPGAYSYTGTRPFFMDDTDMISVTPTAAYPALPSLSVYTDPTSSGQPSPSHVVGSVVPVRLQHAPTLDRTYQFTLVPSTPVETAFLKASTPARTDYLGTAVALSGDVLVVGAPFRGGIGAAFVLRRGATGWTEEQILRPTAVAGARAGGAVAIDADILVVGAPFDATGSSGRAYVYRYASGTWILDGGGTLAPNTAASARCGSAVAISGTRIIIGCPGENGSGNKTEVGAVYMFRYDTPTSTWMADGAFKGLNTTDTLGAAVAISGTTAVAGAANEDNGTTADAGGVHVLVRGASTWSQQGTTLRGDLTAGSRFGTAVAISGDYAIVGAPDVSSGFAYAFHRVTTTWSMDGPKLAPTLAGADAPGFGTAVAIDGTHIVIGAPKQDHTAGDTGAVHAYRREPSGWTNSVTIGASNPSVSKFGASVAVDGEWIAAGAPEESTTAGASGAVYVFR